MATPLLRLEEVNIRYRRQRAVEDLSLTVEEGEILGIVGESGSGKSTLLRGIIGLLGSGGTVERGRILYRDRDITRLPPAEMTRLRGREIAMVFQNTSASLCPVRTVWDQLREMGGGEIPAQEMRRRALELMEKVHLEERVLSSYPFELSGGMNQRVGIVMAMALRPSLLLADEPTSALDVTVQKQVIGELLALRESYGTAIVIVSHNIGVVARMAHRVAVMKGGRLVEWGTADQVLRHPAEPYTRQLIAAVPRLRRS